MPDAHSGDTPGDGEARIDKSPTTPAFPTPAVATPCRAPEGGPKENPPTTPSSEPSPPSSQHLEGNRPDPGVLRISEAAADARLRRTMQPSLKDGSFKVSQEVLKQYRKGGKAKKSLMKLFETCGYDKDRSVCFLSMPQPVISPWQPRKTGVLPAREMAKLPSNLTESKCKLVQSKCWSAERHPQETFLEELELIREDELASDLLIEGEFLTESQMIENWGWSQPL